MISPIKVHPVSLSEIQKRCEAVIDQLQVTEDEVNTIEVQTRKQSHCSEWFHHRKYRITASKAYRCASLKESTSPTKAVEEVLCYKKVYSTKAMKDGLNQEPVIVNEYTKEKENNGVSVVVKDCGFFVSPKAMTSRHHNTEKLGSKKTSHSFSKWPRFLSRRCDPNFQTKRREKIIINLIMWSHFAIMREFCAEKFAYEKEGLQNHGELLLRKLLASVFVTLCNLSTTFFS